MSSHTPSTSNQFRHLSARLVGQVAAALTPVAILVTAFAIAGERLSSYTLHGVALTAVIVACAVVVPLLSQTLSAPVYAGLEDVDYTDRPLVARTVLHVLPRGAALALPVAAVAGVMLGLHAGWDAAVVAAVVVLIALHLVMAMLMVVGFATRSAVGLVAGWIAYGVALATVPQLWWLPPLAGAVVLLALALVSARRTRDRVQMPSWRTLVTRLGTGAADAVPMWVIPPVMWVLAGAQFHAFVVFAAIIPAMIAYQTFFVTMAGPLWATTSRLQDALSNLPYGLARETVVEPAVRRARRTSAAVVVLNVTLVVLSSWLWDAVAGRSIDFALLVAGAGAACCAVALAYQYSILGSRRPMTFLAVALGLVALTAVLLRATPHVFLLAYTVTAALGSVVLLAANRRVWLQPEYRLFWAKAVRL